MDAIIKTTEKADADEMVAMLKMLSVEDKQRMRDFISGVEFAKKTAAETEKRSA